MADGEVKVKFSADASEFEAAAKRAAAATESIAASAKVASGAIEVETAALNRQEEQLVRLDAAIGRVGKAEADQVLRVSQLSRLYEQGAIDVEGFKERLSALDATYDRAGEHAEHFSLASARARTELLVLGDEISQGRYTRLTGSLMVLAEYAGGVSLAMMAMGGAGYIAGHALYSIVENANETEAALKRVESSMYAVGDGALWNQDAVGELIHQLSLLPGVGKEGAEKIVDAFARTHQVGGQLFADLTLHIDKFAQLLGKDAPDAAKELATAFADPAAGAEKLDHALDLLSAAQLRSIQDMQRSGDFLGAQRALYAALIERAGALPSQLTRVEEANHRLALAWERLTGSASAHRGEMGLVEHAWVAFLDDLTRANDLIKTVTDSLGYMTRAALNPLAGLAGVDLMDHYKVPPPPTIRPAAPDRQKDEDTVKGALAGSRESQGERDNQLLQDEQRLLAGIEAAKRRLKELDAAGNGGAYRQEEDSLERLEQRLQELREKKGDGMTSAVDAVRARGEAEIAAAREALQHRQQMGEISRGEELRGEVALEDKLYSVQRQALVDRQTLQSTSLTEKASLDRRLEALEREHQLKVQTLRDQAQVADKKDGDKDEVGLVQSFKQEFEELHTVEGKYHALSKADEAKFWEDKLKEVQDGSKDYAAVYAEVVRAEKEAAQEARKFREEDLADERAHRLAMVQLAAGAQGAPGDDKETGLANLRALKDQEYQIELEALTKKKALYNDDLAAQRKVMGELKALEDKHALDVQSVAKQEAQARLTEVQQWTAPVKSAMNTMVQGYMQGTLTMQQLGQRAASSIATSYISKAADMAQVWVEKHVLMAAWDALFATRSVAAATTAEAGKTAATVGGVAARQAAQVPEQAGFLAKLGEMVAGWLGFEVGKTTATTTQAGVRAAADIAAANATALINIKADAATAGAAAYASTCAIPVVGPELAPEAAAAAYTATMAFGASLVVPSAQGGMVSTNEGLMMVHEAETVLPASYASGLRNLLAAAPQFALPGRLSLPSDLFDLPSLAFSQAQSAGGGAASAAPGAGGAGGAGGRAYNITIQATDPRSMAAYIQQPTVRAGLITAINTSVAQGAQLRTR